MNIKHEKSKIVYEFTPVTYKDKQYTCTISEPNNLILVGIISGIGGFVFFLILVAMDFAEKNPDLIESIMSVAGIPIVLIVLVFAILWSGIVSTKENNIFSRGSVEGRQPRVHLQCSLYALDDNSKIYEKDICMFLVEWNDMREQYDYQDLISYIFTDYERNQAKDKEIESKKNWNMVVETEQNQEEK